MFDTIDLKDKRITKIMFVLVREIMKDTIENEVIPVMEKVVDYFKLVIKEDLVKVIL